MPSAIETFDVEKQPSIVSEPPMSRHSMLSMQLLLALNAALMFTALLFGWSVYQDVSVKYNGVQSLMMNPKALGPYADVVIREAISSFLFGSDERSSFILGAINGSLAQFASNMLRPEYYAQTAMELESFSQDLMMTFDNNASTCQDFMTCPSSPNGQYPFSMQCNTGKMVWCYFGGEQKNCANQTCIAHYVYSVATMVNSVSSLVEQLNGVEQASNSGAAFNSGLFNIEALLPWIERQANAMDWNAAGVRCLDMVSRVKSVAWNGAYVDFDGRNHQFNVSDKVAQGADYAAQICNDLVQLSDSFMDKKDFKKHLGGLHHAHHAHHHHRQ